MFGVSMVVMISSRRGSYALAGAITAVAVLVLAVAGPVLGRLIDRHGQRRIAMPFIPSPGCSGGDDGVVLPRRADLDDLLLHVCRLGLPARARPMSRPAGCTSSATTRTRCTRRCPGQILEGAFRRRADPRRHARHDVVPEAGLLLAQPSTPGRLHLPFARATEPPWWPRRPASRTDGSARPAGLFVVAAILTMVGVASSQVRTRVTIVVVCEGGR